MRIKFVLIMPSLFFSGHLYAGAYKCTDEFGKTTYQAQPCVEEKQAVEIDLKTGTVITREAEKRKKEMALKMEREQMELQQRKDQLIKDTQEQSKINQELIKNNPGKYSAYAIPPYTEQHHPDFIDFFEWRMPEIERYRRKAAELVLKKGLCKRVEASELNMRSKPDNLVFLVDCSSGYNLYLDEQQLDAE